MTPDVFTFQLSEKPTSHILMQIPFPATSSKHTASAVSLYTSQPNCKDNEKCNDSQPIWVPSGERDAGQSPQEEITNKVAGGQVWEST
jgi:hypothetical protein